MVNESADVKVVLLDPTLLQFQMPAVFFLAADGRQDACGLTSLDDAHDGIRFRPFEIRFHELIPSTLWSLHDGRVPFLRSILGPVVKLRGDVAQDSRLTG